MASPTIPLSSVTERSINFTVVLTLGSIKSSKKTTQGDKTLQNLLFTDTEGNEIIATIFQTDISSFRNILHEGHQYEIHNPIVNKIPERYRYGNQMYQMIFEKGLHIIDLGQIESTKTFWVPVNSFDENLQRRDRIDLVVVAIFVRPLRRTTNRATGDENEARDIIIVDHQMRPVVLTAWRALALEPTEKIARAIDSLPVIQITRVKASDYRGGCWGTTRFSTLRLDSTEPAAEELRIWATDKKEFLKHLSNNYRPDVSGASSSRETESLQTPIPISDLPNQEVDKIILIEGQIKSIINPDTFVFNSCNKCKKFTTTETGASFRCVGGQTSHYGISESTCSLKIIFSDKTGETRISLFASLAEKVLRRTITELVALTPEERRSVVDEVLTTVRDQYFIIELLSYIKNDPVPQLRFSPQQITEKNP